MKKVIYSILFLSFISSIFFLSCQKDEIETENDTVQVQTRTSDLSDVFFRTTLTTDNYIVANNTIPRIYRIFNASKVDSIEMYATGDPDINSGGILLKKYKIVVRFIDSTDYSFIAYSKSIGNQFGFVPYGENQLRDVHSAKFLLITSLGRNEISPLYNLWRDQSFTPLEWEIKKDGDIFITKSILYPLDKTSNIFRPKMMH